MVNDSGDNRKIKFTVRDRIAASGTVLTLAGLIATFGAAIKWR